MLPGFESAGTYTPDGLIAGEQPRVTKNVTLLSGENRTRGALLGRITTSSLVGAADAGNTGNGVLGAVTAGAKTQPGVYTIEIITAAANAGTFRVIAPDGQLLPNGTVAVAYTSSHINFTLADGATDFVVGDKFTVTVTGTGKFKLSASAAVDGSQNPVGILVDDTDASAADKTCAVYLTGEFASNKVTFGTGHTADSVYWDLAARGLFIRDVLGA